MTGIGMLTPHGQQRGHGFIRSHLRQRERYRRDGGAGPEGPADHGGPRRGREHHEGNHEGRGNRLRGHRCRVSVRLVLHRRDPGQKALGFCAGNVAFVTGIRISVPNVFIGLLIGASIPWLFSSLTVNSVARAAGLIVEEVRRQFRIPGLLAGKVKPDYGQTVSLLSVNLSLISVPLWAWFHQYRWTLVVFPLVLLVIMFSTFPTQYYC